jgi:hypothetical protein
MQDGFGREHMTHKPYGLSPDIYVRLDRNHYVLLDLRRNLYSCMARSDFEPVVRHVLEAGRAGAAMEVVASPDASYSLAQATAELVGNGILRTLADGGKEYVENEQPAPTCPFLLETGGITSCRPWRYAAAFLASCAWADISLRHLPLERIISQIRRWKSDGRCGSEALEHRRTPELITSFIKLRPLYPRDYLCMFDSLSLLRFLQHFHITASWVFGVCAEPFAAHCWLQSGSVALNDTPARVSIYKPIMAV